MSKFLIIGLGNIGTEYAGTRHNIGFDVAHAFVEKHGGTFKVDRLAYVAEVKWKGKQFVCICPTTYMNLSGRAVRELLGFYKVPVSDLLVIHDDMDLPVGRIRLRSRGSSGGHNGIRSIIAEIGTEEFWRLKVGIGRPPAAWDPARFVLASFTNDEIKPLEEALTRAVAAVKLWLRGESSQAMNLYNR